MDKPMNSFDARNKPQAGGVLSDFRTVQATAGDLADGARRYRQMTDVLTALVGRALKI